MIIWVIGKSAAGKTIIGQELYQLIKQNHQNTVFLDSEVFREIHDNDLGHTLEERNRNGRRVCRMCKFLDQQGIHVVCAILSNSFEDRQWNRENYSTYFEVFLDVPFSILVKRDPKGLYEKAIHGEINNMVGIDILFTPPKNPDLIIKNEGKETPVFLAKKIFGKLNL